MGGINKLIQGDFFKMSLLFMLLSSFFMMILTDVRKLFSKNKKKALVYGIIILATFAVAGLLSSSKVLNDTPLNSFIGFQVLFLILGSIHVWVLRTYFKELSEDKNKFFPEFFFSLVFVLVGLIAFFKVTESFKSPFKFIFLTSALAFIVPLLVYKLYEYALLIPVKIFDQWIYPNSQEIKDPTEEELRNPLVISFEFRKNGEEDTEVTNFRIKAPLNLTFGKLFYFFLNDYNERHPESKISYFDNENSPHKWVFFRKPSFFKPLRYINHTKTVSANSLREDDVIICKRS